MWLRAEGPPYRPCKIDCHRWPHVFHHVPRVVVIYMLFLPSATMLRQGNVFTPVCQSFCSGGVCLWSGGVSATHTPPPRQTHPLSQTSPLGRHPLGRHPRADTPQAHTPLPSACWDTHTPCPVHAGIRSTSGWYACHWNAFFFDYFCFGFRFCAM